MGNLFCCVQVDQSTVAIKERFGRFDEVLQPGCHCLPWFLGSQLAGHLTLRVQQLDVRCETKTKVCLFTLLKNSPNPNPFLLSISTFLKYVPFWREKYNKNFLSLYEPVCSLGRSPGIFMSPFFSIDEALAES